MKWSHTTTQTTEARYVSVGRLDTQRVFQWRVQIRNTEGHEYQQKTILGENPEQW